MNNRAFTLIELLVVITIVGILVLLATPGIMNASEKAKIVHIKNDIKVVEGELDVYRMSRIKGGKEIFGKETGEKIESYELDKDNYTLEMKELLMKRTTEFSEDSLSNLKKLVSTHHELTEKDWPDFRSIWRWYI